MMRYFYDLEFDDDGERIIPISLGMQSEDDRELYRVNLDYFEGMQIGLYKPNRFVIDNVLPLITDTDKASCGIEHSSFKEAIYTFVTDNGRYKKYGEIELWGYFAAYDHVSLSQFFGRMVDLPEPMPMYTNETMQLPNRHKTKPLRKTPEHHALWDAQYQRQIWKRWK